MNLVALKVNGEVLIEQPKPSREFVLDFENSLRDFGEQNGTLIDADELTTHYFAPGIYAREMRIPAGVCATGKIHRHAHLLILLQGRVSLLTEHGMQTLDAPYTARSEAGIKRVAYAHTDSVLICVHHNPDDCKDIPMLESRYIAPSFEALEVMP